MKNYKDITQFINKYVKFKDKEKMYEYTYSLVAYKDILYFVNYGLKNGKQMGRVGHFNNWLDQEKVKLGSLVKINSIVYQIKLFNDDCDTFSVNHNHIGYLCLVPV
jgi:hypothetical protein